MDGDIVSMSEEELWAQAPDVASELEDYLAQFRTDEYGYESLDEAAQDICVTPGIHGVNGQQEHYFLAPDGSAAARLWWHDAHSWGWMYWTPLRGWWDREDGELEEPTL
jgi:hypothetical protein